LFTALFTIAAILAWSAAVSVVRAYAVLQGRP
jgi:hypothetical protein